MFTAQHIFKLLFREEPWLNKNLRFFNQIFIPQQQMWSAVWFRAIPQSPHTYDEYFKWLVKSWNINLHSKYLMECFQSVKLSICHGDLFWRLKWFPTLNSVSFMGDRGSCLRDAGNANTATFLFPPQERMNPLDNLGCRRHCLPRSLHLLEVGSVTHS